MEYRIKPEPKEGSIPKSCERLGIKVGDLLKSNNYPRPVILSDISENMIGCCALQWDKDFFIKDTKDGKIKKLTKTTRPMTPREIVSQAARVKRIDEDDIILILRINEDEVYINKDSMSLKWFIANYTDLDGNKFEIKEEKWQTVEWRDK